MATAKKTETETKKPVAKAKATTGTKPRKPRTKTPAKPRAYTRKKNETEENPFGLSDIELQFAEEYLRTYNVCGAWNKVVKPTSNYSESYCLKAPYMMLEKEHIKAYVEDRRKKTIDAMRADAMRLIEELFKIVDDPKTSTQNRLKAIAQLSKNLGAEYMNIGIKAEVQADVKSTVKYEDLSESDLEAILAAVE